MSIIIVGVGQAEFDGENRNWSKKKTKNSGNQLGLAPKHNKDCASYQFIVWKYFLFEIVFHTPFLCSHGGAGWWWHQDFLTGEVGRERHCTGETFRMFCLTLSFLRDHFCPSGHAYRWKRYKPRHLNSRPDCFEIWYSPSFLISSWKEIILTDTLKFIRHIHAPQRMNLLHFGHSLGVFLSNSHTLCLLFSHHSQAQMQTFPTGILII